MTYPTSPDDIIGEDEARRITRCDSDSTWQRWHERGVILWFVPPGTRRRSYSRAWFVDWYRAGRRGAAEPVSPADMSPPCLDGGVCADEQCAECAEARRLAMQDMEQREAKRRTSPNNRERTGGDQ